MKIQQYLFNFKTFSLTVPLGLLIASSISVNAQIVPDRSLGSENSVVTPNVIINGIDSDHIDGGAVRGSNLFQSFQEFNVGEGRGAYFSNPTGIANIFSRVTGGNISQILGTLGVLGNANLYFLNPNGILFGPNSQLDIKGSFLATTVDNLQFDNGYLFSATQTQSPPLLKINILVGLHLREAAGNISISGKNVDSSNTQSSKIPIINISDSRGYSVLFFRAQEAEPKNVINLDITQLRLDLISAVVNHIGALQHRKKVFEFKTLITRNSCERRKVNHSELINIGRTALPPNLTDDFSGSNIQVYLVEKAALSNNNLDVKEPIVEVKELVRLEPAQGWESNAKGQMVLIGYNGLENDSLRLPLSAPSCSIDNHYE